MPKLGGDADHSVGVLVIDDVAVVREVPLALAEDHHVFAGHKGGVVESGPIDPDQDPPKRAAVQAQIGEPLAHPGDVKVRADLRERVALALMLVIRFKQIVAIRVGDRRAPLLALPVPKPAAEHRGVASFEHVGVRVQPRQLPLLELAGDRIGREDVAQASAKIDPSPVDDSTLRIVRIDEQP